MKRSAMRLLAKVFGMCGVLFTAGIAFAGSFTFDLLSSHRIEFPSWVPERPLAIPKAQSELTFPVIPDAAGSDLVVTVVFREEIGSYLSVYWENAEGKRQLVASNLFENTGLLNQRTILINRPTMEGPGKVVLKSSQSALNVLRVRLDWARPGVVRLVDNVPNGALITTGGKFLAPEEVDGTQLTPIADSWEGRILTTSVTDQAERIEKGIDYQVSIPSKVNRARIELLVNGLPLNQNLKLWLNGNSAGTIIAEVPDLTDPGYDRNNPGTMQFVGWRKATLILSGSKLPIGDNHFQIETPQGSNVAIRDLLLQVDYAAN
jgi:hypothetical protein